MDGNLFRLFDMNILLFLLVLISSNSFAVTYSYDSSGKLIGADYGNGTEIGYAYDQAGNIQQVEPIAFQGTNNLNVPVEGSTEVVKDCHYYNNCTCKEDEDECICFVATAAYGSAMQPKVVVLRQFRNQYLLTNDIGTFLVGMYYKHSPPFARYISKREWLRATVRAVLTPIVYLIEYPAKSGGVIIIFLLGVAGLVRRKRFNK